MAALLTRNGRAFLLYYWSCHNWVITGATLERRLRVAPMHAQAVRYHVRLERGTPMFFGGRVTVIGKGQ